MVRDMNRLLQRDLGQRLGRQGITIGYWYVLRVLWLQDGLTQSEIAQRGGIAAPSVVVAVRGLLAEKIIVRDRHPTDQRKNVIFLTKKGRQLETSCLDAAAAVNNLALTGVSNEELEVCMSVFRRVMLNLVGDIEDQAASDSEREPDSRALARTK